MRVDIGRAVTGEVLCARRHSTRLQAGHESPDMPGDELGARSERAHADDGVQGVGVDVRNGCEIVGDADGTELVGERLGNRFRELDVVDHAEGELTGNRASASRLQPGDVASLLVDRHDRRGRYPKRGGQPVELVRVLHVAREEHHPTETVVELAEKPVRGSEPREPGQNARVRKPIDRVAHPLTAPAVRPNAICRCTSRKKTTTGIAVSVDAAMRPPQSVLRLVP